MNTNLKLTGLFILLMVLCSRGYAAGSLVCASEVSKASFQRMGTPLQARAEPINRTSGRVPHVQIDAIVDEGINDQLRALAFAIPGVEKQPTIASLPGGLGMRLSNELPVQFPRAIVAGREFTHIHVDGSLHAPLPVGRAKEVVRQGWGEKHPWANRFDGWDGLVMLFSPRTTEELTVVFQLIVESYNHITGQDYGASDCDG